MGIEEARAKLGDLVTDAQHHGTATVITRNGRQAAILMPLHPAEKHDDPEMREALVYGIAMYILRGRMHTKRPGRSEAQILAQTRRDMDDVLQYGYSFSDGEAKKIATDATALADRQQDTNPDWDQWAQGH